MSAAVHVMKGGEAHLPFALYRPDTHQLGNPEELPAGPRFVVKSAGDPVAGFSSLPFTRQLAPGCFSLVLPIPIGQVLPAGDYTVEVDQATIINVPMVDINGDPLTQDLVIADAPDSPYTQARLYAEPEELEQMGAKPCPTVAEITMAQMVMDGFMHRASLWPTIIEQERHPLPPDRMQTQLDVKPVIRLVAAESMPAHAQGLRGRYGYGRRDRQFAGNYELGVAFMVMGAPGQLTPVDINNVTLHSDSGMIWIPRGVFPIRYTEILVTYEAGLMVIPMAVKMALLSIIMWMRFKGHSGLTGYGVNKVNKQMTDTFMTKEAKVALDKYVVWTKR